MNNTTIFIPLFFIFLFRDFIKIGTKVALANYSSKIPKASNIMEIHNLQLGNMASFYP